MHLYLVRFYDLDDKPFVLKVGITSNDLTNRLYGLSIPFRMDLIFHLEGGERKLKAIEKDVVEYARFNSLCLPRGREYFRYSQEFESKILEIIKMDRKARKKKEGIIEHYERMNRGSECHYNYSCS